MSSEVEVHLSCRLFYVDMEGLNDARAVKTIVPQVNPRKMVGFLLHKLEPRSDPLLQIIVHATSEATDALLESCRSIRVMTRDIYTPLQGENVQIGQHVNSFSLSLSESLLASVAMSRVSLILLVAARSE